MVRCRDSFPKPHFHPQAHARPIRLVIVTLHTNKSAYLTDGDSLRMTAEVTLGINKAE
jgi:hypothetical protein